MRLCRSDTRRQHSERRHRDEHTVILLQYLSTVSDSKEADTHPQPSGGLEALQRVAADKVYVASDTND